MTHSPRKALPSRRGFTLVELIVLVALLVVLGLLIAWGVRRTSRVASLKALRDMGVTVEMNGEELTGIRFENCFLGDDVMMDHVANLGTFKTLNVRNTDVSDVGLKALPDPAAITHLDLTLTGIGDESLKYIGEECPNLTSLDLTATLISEEGLASFSDAASTARSEASSAAFLASRSFFLRKSPKPSDLKNGNRPAQSRTMSPIDSFKPVFHVM